MFADGVRVRRIRIWPRDDHSGVLIGAGGMLHSDWPAINNTRATATTNP